MLLKNPVAARELLRCDFKLFITVFYFYMSRREFIFKWFHLEIIKKLEGCKSITDIEKSNKKFADVMLEIFKTIHFGERKYNRQYNEILISRPKIQGVFSYGQSYENIPLFLRKYAQDNDLPIIMFG